MSIGSRNNLKEYAFRSLGSPVINIDVDDSQVEDRVDDALQFFAEYHFDGVQRLFYRYQITAADIDRVTADPMNGGYIPLDGIDPSIVSIVKLFRISRSETNNLFGVRYQMALNDFYGMRGGFGNLAGYDMAMRHIELFSQMLNPEKQINFSRVTNKLHIVMDWTPDISEGDWIIFECYSVIDPEKAPEIYNDRLVKKYVTALIKRQWGQNLSKFDGIQMPGASTFNGGEIYSQASEEIDKIEERMIESYSLPIDFFTG